MSESVPPWLAKMREITGTKEAAGAADNPVILGWAQFIAHTYPEMAAYCREYRADSIPWCGLTVAYCMAASGIKPVYGGVATQRFLWANAWTYFGKKLDKPKLGCVMVFTRNGGGHVAFYEGEDATHYLIRGGNQSNAVNVTRYPKSQFTGAYWPTEAATVAAPARAAPLDLQRRMGKAIVDFEARRDRQGRLVVYNPPANDGGGAYEVAGINVRYHPAQAAKLKALIEAGKHAEAEDAAIDYLLSYTNAAAGWSKEPGAQFFNRDTAFNRGPTGAAKILQMAVGVDVDGQIGPLTRAAMDTLSPDALIDKLRAARERYEIEVVGRRANLWNGLVNRWNKVQAQAKRFQSEKPILPRNTLPVASGVGIFAASWAWLVEHPIEAALIAVALAAIGTGIYRVVKKRFAKDDAPRPAEPVAPSPAIVIEDLLS